MAREPLPFDVCLVPGEFAPERAAGCTAVVIDVLRFSTTLVQAFESGAASATPVDDPAAALEKIRLGEADLACGERGGVKLPGFHLGNSPFEYVSSAVSGRRLAFTTTNGTRLLLASRSAGRVLVGCFRNLLSLARELDRLGAPVLVACGGTDGRFALEDALAAGALAECVAAARPLAPTDGAVAAVRLWRGAAADLAGSLQATDHGRALTALGFGGDVAFAALSAHNAPVPVWDRASGLLSPQPTV